MEPRQFLRGEGLAVLAVSLGAYFTLDGPLWLLAALALSPTCRCWAISAAPASGA